jgi:thiamine biosynthesis lipoprotein
MKSEERPACDGAGGTAGDEKTGEPPAADLLKIFLACVAVGMAVGLIVTVGRRFVFQPVGPLPAGPSEAVPGAGMPVTYAFHPMGGIRLELKLWGRDLRLFMGDSEESEKLVEEVERQVSSWRPESATSRLNGAPAGEEVPLSGHALALVMAAFKLNELTAGAFNPALGPGIELWREADRRGAPPSPEEIDRVRELCSMEAFAFDPEKKVVVKRRAGAKLDLGGVGIGYVVDQVVALLKARGAVSGMVTAGRDLRVFGGSVSREAVIPHPEKSDVAYGYFYLPAGAVATAGTGTERGNVLDPRTLRPAAGTLSATVLAPDGTSADGLATALLVLGPEAGCRLVEQLAGIEALFLAREGDEIRPVRTPGFPQVMDISAHEVPPEKLGR